MSEPTPEPEPGAPDFEAPEIKDEPGISDDGQSEREQSEDEPELEPELEPEPGAQQTAQPESAEDRKRVRDAERTVKTYAQRITALYAEEAEHLLACPLCGVTQWPGFVHIGDAGRMPNEVKNAVMTFLGYAAEREYPSVPDFQTCDACHGEGKVSTGSNVPGKTSRDCPRCGGLGYRGAETTHSNGAAPPDLGVTGPTVIPSGAGVPDVDPSGEPRLLPDGRENPNYGKWPQYKVSVDPWGVTAGLTVQDVA